MVDETELEQPSTAPVQNQDEQAQSSSADSETENELLSVVQSAITEDDVEETDSQSDEVEYDEEDETLEAVSDEDTEADESFEDVPFNKHPRFKQLIEERNEYKHGHQQFEQISNYLRENSLSAEEAADGFRIMALMKSKPEEAVIALQPYLQQLALATGQTLPDDIRAKVDDGYMDEETGRELAQVRAEKARQEAINDRLMSERDQAQGVNQLNILADAVTDWEERTRSSDPDYDLKADEIDDRVRVLVSERGRPQTVESAIELAKEAYAEVNERQKARFGNKRPMKTASGGKLGGTPVPEASSLMEAVQNALRTG